MKVALITPTFIAYHAVPNSIINKYKALAKAGHEVNIFTQKMEPENLSVDILKHVYLISSEKIKKFNEGKEPFSEVLEKWYDADIYLFDYPHYYQFIEEMRKVEGVTGFIYHGITPPTFAAAEKRSFYTTSILYLNSLKYTDFGIVYSQYTKDELVKKHRFNSQKIIQIPFGVDIKSFEKQNKDVLVKQYQLQDKCVLSYVGRVSPHKNIELLVNALPKLLEIKKNIFLFIIGDDSGDYGKEKARLLGLAKSLNVETNIKFTGLVDNLPDYYGISDVIVSASLHEGCWVPGLEAIASRKPIVAAENTAIPYTAKRAGLYFDPGSENAYVKTVLSVLMNTEIKNKLMLAAKRQIKNISIEAHNKAFLEVVNQAIKMKKPKKIVEAVSSAELIEKLKVLERLKDVRIDYHEFSDRKILGVFLSKFRGTITKHIRQFYIKELEALQVNFNHEVVESYRVLLNYIAIKEKWETKAIKSALPMSEKELYDRDYFIGGNKSNYGDYKEVSGVIKELSEMIFRLFHPKSLLDIGCAYGYAPIYLRKMGVEAYGIDISDFAIAQGGKNYLVVGDATDLQCFKDGQFEVVLASELMEHIPEVKIDKAVEEAKRVSKKFIVYLIAMTGFTSHDSVHDHDISHVSMKNRKFWLKKFEKFNLVRDREKENALNTDKLSIKMGWSGRFFVLKVS